MLAKRSDAEGNIVDRELALVWITSAWVVVLSILFWATTPSPGSLSIGFLIQGGVGGDVACAGGEDECAAGVEIIRTAMPQEFDPPPAMAWKGLTEPTQVSLRWWRPKRLTTMVRAGRLVVFVSSQSAGDGEETEDAWRAAA